MILPELVLVQRGQGHAVHAGGGRDQARLPRARDQQHDGPHLRALEHLREQQVPAHVPEPHRVVRVERDATPDIRHVAYYSADAGTVRVCSFVQNDSRRS